MKKILYTSLFLFFTCFAFTGKAQNCAATAGFIYSPTSATLTYQFTDSSKVEQGWLITNVYWNFGDSSATSSDLDPTHTYKRAGKYKVCYYVHAQQTGTTNYCYGSICDSITVGSNTPCNVNAAWTYSSTSGGGILFTGVVNPSGAHTPWSFGDGTSSVDANPTHYYKQSGTYHVCHYVYIPGTTCSDSVCNNIIVNITNACANITAAFGLRDSAGGIFLYNTAINPTAARYQWSMDGKVLNSTPYPYTTFFEANVSSGTHRFCERVYSGNATTFCDSTCQSITIAGCNLNADWSSAVGKGDSIVFTSTHSNPSGTHFDWKFGDGSYGFGISTTHAYAKSGTYRVCLYAYTGSNCIDSVCNNIVFTLPCTANAKWTYSAITGGGIQFFSVTNQSTPHSYWTFGDGSTSGDVNPTHYYKQTGTYHVCHYVYLTGQTCLDTVCDNIAVTNVSTCSGISASFIYSVSGNTVVLSSNASNPSSVYYRWELDGKTIATGASNSSYTATNVTTGTHNFCLLVYNNTSIPCDSSCQSVVINGTCNVNASWTYKVNSDGSIQFTGVTNSTNAHTPWTFGDGTYSTDINPTHTYAKSGTYHVCHFVYIPNTTCIDSSCDNITVKQTSPCAGVSADFSYTITGSAVTLQSTGTNPSGTLYAWSMDGKSITSPGANMAYTVTGVTSGEHHFCLFVYGPNATVPCDSTCKAVTITSGTCTVNAQWTWSYTSNGGVQFTGATNPTNAHTGWSFGDGSSSSLNDPTHVYAKAGIYHVCRYAYIPATTCIDSSCNDITITISTTCKDYFLDSTYSNSTLVKFFSRTYVSTGDTVNSYYWSFGDGSSSHDANVSHTYKAPGNYEVCLTTSTVKGCTSTYCDSVYAGSRASACQSDYTYTIKNCNVVSFNNTSTGNFTSQTWVFGDGTTSTDANPTHTFSNTGTYNVYLRIANTATGCLSYSYQAITIQSCVINDTICGIVFGDSNGDGVMDSAEAGLKGVTVHIDNTEVISDSSGHYFEVVPHSAHYIYITPPTGCVITLPFASSSNSTSRSGVYYIPSGGTNNNLCGFNFGIDCNVVHLCGTVYFDANNNGAQDIGESGIPNVVIAITGNNGNVHHAYTDANGNYCETLPEGVYTVTATSSTYKTCTTTPSILTVNADTAGNTFGNNNFAVYCQPGSCDLSLKITPYTTVTPGYPAYYSLYACNVGTNVANGTVSLFYDEAVHFKYAYPVQATIDSNARVITWSVSNLFPGGCTSIIVYFTANVPLTVGQHVFTIGNIVTDNSCADVNPNNNVDTLHQEVTSSWDPNNKLAYLTNYTDPTYQQVSSQNSNQRIEYVINFQNAGNGPAYNIVVLDTLSHDLDANSFEFLGSSHPCSVVRNGNLLNFNFSNIMLPAESTDEPGSHAFVKFAVNANDGLPSGHVISDPADIYFDYNLPMQTNDAAVQMLDVTGAGTIVLNSTVLVAPNPMTDYTTISLKNNEKQGFTLRIMDITGRYVTEQVSLNNTVQFNRNSLPAGVYLYEIVQQNQPVARGKLVIQ